MRPSGGSERSERGGRFIGRGSPTRRCRRSRCAPCRRSCRYFGGSKPMPTPPGVPVAMRSPGSSVMPAEIVSINAGTPKMRSRVDCVLAQLAVDPQPHAKIGAVELVGRDDPRAHRAEGVERLAEQELLVALLHVARGNVVEDRVAEHVVERARRRDAATALADHHHELRFVVDRLRHARRNADRRAGRDHAVGYLGKDDRVLGRRRRATGRCRSPRIRPRGYGS